MMPDQKLTLDYGRPAARKPFPWGLVIVLSFAVLIFALLVSSQFVWIPP
jgi:hypothetical protein